MVKTISEKIILIELLIYDISATTSTSGQVARVMCRLKNGWKWIGSILIIGHWGARVVLKHYKD